MCVALQRALDGRVPLVFLSSLSNGVIVEKALEF